LQSVEVGDLAFTFLFLVLFAEVLCGAVEEWSVLDRGTG
jgi:hypothetical protein